MHAHAEREEEPTVDDSSSGYGEGPPFLPPVRTWPYVARPASRSCQRSAVAVASTGAVALAAFVMSALDDIAEKSAAMTKECSGS